jgi:hypothetical protein
MLLTFSVATIVPPIDRWLGGAGFANPWLDTGLSTTLLALSATYLYIPTGAVYGARGSVRLFKAAALTVGVAAVVLGYRFALAADRAVQHVSPQPCGLVRAEARTD